MRWRWPPRERRGNKGWPSLLWTLYNNDGDQAGSFFGAKKANEPLHVLNSYEDGGVTVDNLGADRQDGLTVQSKVYDVDGKVLDDQPGQPAGPPRRGHAEDAAGQGRYLLRGTVAASGQPDRRPQRVLDVHAAGRGGLAGQLWQPAGDHARYANLQGLQSLQQAKVAASERQRDGERVTKVPGTNTSKQPVVGFFLRADIRRGNADGTERPGDNQVTSGLWSGNDVTLWPGESQTLTVPYDAADLHGATPVVSLQGWNLPKLDVKAGGDAGSCAAQAAAATVLHVG